MRNPSLDQIEDRAFAERVACQSCKAPAGQTCVRIDNRTRQRVPVENFPAHLSRIRRAARTDRLATEETSE